MDDAKSVPHRSRTEWAGVALALAEAGRRDRQQQRPGWFARWASCAGQQRTRPDWGPALDDTKVEVVRRFVRETRRRGHAAEEFNSMLLDQGFSPAQVAALALLST
jgi:hypothetical protein